MARYNIYYHRYNIIARDYIPYVRVVETEDIYHEIGKMICTTLEEMKHIRYTKPKATHEECVQLWEDKHYVKISDDTWRLDNPEYKDVEFEQPTEPIPIEPKKLAEMLCLAVRQMTDDEGHCDWWVQGVLDISDDDYQYIYNYLPQNADTE